MKRLAGVLVTLIPVIAMAHGGGLTYGDFARRMNTISIAEKQVRNQREVDFQSKLEKEKDRGLTTTSQIQQSAQGAASTYKPTFTRCNRIGTQVFCNSF